MSQDYRAEKLSGSIRIPDSLGSVVQIEGRWAEVIGCNNSSYLADVIYLDKPKPEVVPVSWAALQEGPGFRSASLGLLIRTGQGPSQEEIDRMSGTPEQRLSRRTLGPYVIRRKDRVDSDVGERRVEVVD
jgi:hypothetical protein